MQMQGQPIGLTSRIALGSDVEAYGVLQRAGLSKAGAGPHLQKVLLLERSLMAYGW